MKIEHTPGPWEIWTSFSFCRISSKATGRDGDVLHAVVQSRDGHPDLCFPNGGFTGPDARLIEAAPELLTELRDLRARFHRAIISGGSAEWAADASCAKADAAIAKATESQA